MAHSMFCLRPSSILDLVYVYYEYKEECIEDAKLLFNRSHMLYNWQIAIEKKDLQPYTQDASNIVSKASLFELNEYPPTLLSVERVGYPCATMPPCHLTSTKHIAHSTQHTAHST